MSYQYSPNALGIHNSQSNFDFVLSASLHGLIRLAALQCRKKGGLLRSPLAFSISKLLLKTMQFRRFATARKFSRDIFAILPSITPYSLQIPKTYVSCPLPRACALALLPPFFRGYRTCPSRPVFDCGVVCSCSVLRETVFKFIISILSQKYCFHQSQTIVESFRPDHDDDEGCRCRGTGCY